MTIRIVHVRIEGRVQGVGYRAWTDATARSLGVTGWVRNRRDGMVEAVFQGRAEQVEHMLRLCEQGPLHAYVTGVHMLAHAGGPYSTFEVLPTA